MLAIPATPKKEGPLGLQREDPKKDRETAEDDNTTQNISARHISSTKLITMLRTKFGIGAYDVHVSTSARVDDSTIE